MYIIYVITMYSETYSTELQFASVGDEALINDFAYQFPISGNFLNSLLSIGNYNSKTVFDMNIRSAPTNLQVFVDTILINSNVKFDAFDFTETRLDHNLASLYQLLYAEIDMVEVSPCIFLMNIA